MRSADGLRNDGREPEESHGLSVLPGHHCFGAVDVHARVQL